MHIVGHSWEAIKRAQTKQGSLNERIDVSKAGDYGADPMGDGTFRMVPSGDIVDFAERQRRLAR